MGAKHKRGFSAVLLSEQGAEGSGEDIAHARGRHAGIAGGVDEPVAVASDDDAAVAFEDDVRVEVLGEILRRFQAIRLDISGRLRQQARGFGGMRGE